MLDTVWKCSQLCVKSKDLEPQGVRKYIKMGKLRLGTLLMGAEQRQTLKLVGS